jgi:hypothetical protein
VGSEKTIDQKAEEHSLQFDNLIDRDWAKYSFRAGYSLAKSEDKEKIEKLKKALEFYCSMQGHQIYNPDYHDEIDVFYDDLDGIGYFGKLARQILKEIE